MKQNKKNKIQHRHQSKLTDFFNSTIGKDINCETIVLFNHSNGYKKNLSILDVAISKTQTKTEWNFVKYW